MFSILVLSLLCAHAVSAAEPQSRYSSFSGEVGAGSGSAYSTYGANSQSRITAVRVWERFNSGIAKIQVQHGYYWNTVCGTGSGTVHEFQLHSDEKIIQASGKYNDYVYQVTFVTNKGRTFTVGQPSGSSFNFYPVYGQSELRHFTGRYNSVGLTSIGFHWGVPFSASRVGLEEDSQLSSGLISSNQTHV